MLQDRLGGVIGIDKNWDRAPHGIVRDKGRRFVGAVEARASCGMHPCTGIGLALHGVTIAQLGYVMMPRTTGGGAFHIGGQDLTIDRGPGGRRPTFEHHARAQPKRQH